MTGPPQPDPAWITSAAQWLTPRRIRAQAIVLALCLWGICAVDFATPGLFDRAANVKFQDFLQFYISARLIRDGRTHKLYDQAVADAEMKSLVGEQARVRLPTVYGPQVGLFFVPLAKLSFPAAARIWVALSLLAFVACIYAVWRCCPNLHPHARMVALCAVAFPPLFHVFVRGQISVPILACFTAAFLGFRARQDWFAGIALGFLVFKPPFLVAIPLILLLAQCWKTLAGLVVSASVQLALTTLYFGWDVMRAYFDTMLHMSRWIGLAEAGPAHIQMHSLRSFWALLVPWPGASLGPYCISALVVIMIAGAICKSSAPLALRFSALTLAAVLVNPHLFVYDLLVLAPAFLLLADWLLSNPHHPLSARVQLLTYLAFLLPLFGPLSRWTHVQLSVPVFVALLWTLWRCSSSASTSPSNETPGHKLDSPESAVV